MKRPLLLPKFYPILDTGVALARGLEPVRVAQDILDSGARILQFRHKTFLSREALGWLEAIAGLTRQAGATLVVNDRADLARLFGAALHLGQDDLPPSAARTILGAEALLGFSTHNETQLRAAAGEAVDYVAVGPIFGTATKENPDSTVGLAELRRLRPFTDRPLCAIGGITRATALDVINAGADSVAIVADLFPDGGDVRERAEEWIRLLA
ncbi:MAG: thiamine phosphate synthase [Acidobacteriota bacterium]